MPPRTPKDPGLKLVSTTAGTAVAKPKPAAKPRPAAVAAPVPVAKPEKPAKAAAKLPKPAKAAKPAKAKPAKAAKPATSSARTKASMLRLRDLVDAVAKATGASKKDAKIAAVATLASLVAALKRGDDLNLPPLGRVRVAKAAAKDGAPVLTLKLRLGTPGGPGAKEALADDGEDG